MIFTFTINGSEYIPSNGNLYKVKSKVENISNIESGEPYIYNETVGKFDIPTGPMSTEAIFIPFEYPDQKTYFTPEESRSGRTFESAMELERLTPNQIVECPECGEWAGEKDDPDTPRCINCGFGMD